MKILAVNNNVIYEDRDGLYVYKETGSFFVDLVKEGHNVSVFQINMLLGPNDTFANFNLVNKDLKIISVKRRKYRLWAYFKAFFVGAYAILKSDFVYLFYPGPICVVLALLSIMFNKKFGLYVRGQAGIDSNISIFLYKRAAVVFTVSPKFTNIIKDFGGNSFTIRPMLELSEHDIIDNRNYINKDIYTLLYVGRIAKDKGIFELISSLYNLKEYGIENFIMYIVGNGPDLSALKAKVQEYGMEELICFPGMMSDREALSKLYKEADLFILPTYHEGFPRVLYEAMIFGVPIITTFVGTISYLMKDDSNCYRILPKDDKSLTKILVDFFNSYEKKAHVAKQATKDVRNYFEDKKITHAGQLSNFLNTTNSIN